MRAIALSELTQLFRNRLVAVTSILVPVLFAGVLIATQDNFGGSAIVAALISMTVAAMGTYITITTTLASRRQNLFLKRLRSTAVSDSAIITGLIAPLVVINIVQIAIILVFLAIVGDVPQNAPVVALAIVLLEAMFLGFALATSGLTNSPDHAQVTTLPVFFSAFGAAIWIAFTGSEELAFVKRLIPGGAATELAIEAWNGIDPVDIVPLVLPTLAWVFVAFVVASQLFRWEPRR
ncbi:ABC transporter permease [Microbacterium marinilacus]|uniref:ABC transporter permease n=1 Tax=Microbacterium marinilacus TaxID=415209 RepID=A0ABP7BN57_9MICO|nr:ABC transporter permease [Microbacterium marinilacus]MBY0688821.1 ABC transporter permease [Microbacterium marinilacus]